MHKHAPVGRRKQLSSSRALLVAALTLVVLAGCSNSSAEEVADLQRELAAAQERIAQNEVELDTLRSELDGDSARIAAEPATSDAQYDQSVEVSAELSANVSSMVENSRSTDGAVDLFAVSNEIFGELPDFGEVDREFGGISVTGASERVDIVMSKNGLLHVDSLAALLMTLGFDEPVSIELAMSPSARTENVDGGKVSVSVEPITDGRRFEISLAQ